MLKKLFDNFSKGLLFIKNNPQISYTVFLIVLIPVAFIISGEEFLSSAKSNQERLEKERVGIMQDIFVELAIIKMDDPVFLQETIERLKEQNKESLAEFKVVKFNGMEQEVIASLDRSEVGKDDQGNVFYYNQIGARDYVSKLFPIYKDGERHWKVLRGVPDRSTGLISGVILLDISMATIDASLARNIQSAYLVLFIIVLAISFLLFRQAKILDYTALYQKLKEVDQMKDDFISMAAHELRTPLTVVKGYAEILRSSKNLKDEDMVPLSRITVSVSQLDALITDVLDVIRLGQGKMIFKLENLDISPVLEKVIETFKHVAEEKGLDISYEKKEIPMINVDAEKLRQVVVNIIGNSIKYTQVGSVKVFVEVDKAMLSIRVRDTGVGISAEDQKRLFEKFFRARTKETEEIRGTGLGLWIAGQVVQNMGGKITVESIKGKGTDVVISFPVLNTKTIER